MPTTTHAPNQDVLENGSGSFDLLELDNQGIVLAVIELRTSEVEALRIVREGLMPTPGYPSLNGCITRLGYASDVLQGRECLPD